MARNHEVTNPRDLLNADGTLAEPGWSKSLVQKYDRNAIKAPKWRIKEWDYYLILADKHAVAFTLSDDGYIGMQSASLLVFDEKNIDGIIADALRACADRCRELGEECSK